MSPLLAAGLLLATSLQNPPEPPLGDKLRAAVPGIEERLRKGGPPAWTELFLELGAYSGKALRNPGGLDGETLDPLAANAIAGARDDRERRLVIRICARLGCRSAIPTLVNLLAAPAPEVKGDAAVALLRLRPVQPVPALRLLLKHADPQVRVMSLRVLAGLGAKEAGPEILEVLRGKEGEDVDTAVWAAGFLGLREAGPRLTELLKSDDFHSKSTAIRALVRLKNQDALPALRALVNDEFNGDSALAAVGRLQGPAGAPEIAAFLKHRQPGLRAAAAETLADLGAVNSLDAISPLLRDRDQDVRFHAGWALHRLGSKQAADLWIRELADPDPERRRDVAGTLGDLRVVEAVSALEKLLKDPDWRVRASAAEALGRMPPSAALPPLEGLLADENAVVRGDAAAALAARGSAAGVETLLREAKAEPRRRLTELNALSRPDAWKALNEAPAPPWFRGYVRDVILQLARNAGFEADFTEGAEAELEDGILGEYGADPRRRTLPELELRLLIPDMGCEIVLEPGRVRILSRREALEYWTLWAEARPKK